MIGDYPIDESLAKSQDCMRPPAAGHPRRCQARSRVTRNQCKRWAMHGSHYCPTHGGRASFHKEKKLAGLYSRRAKKRLAALLEDAAAADRASLEEEVDLSRVLCARAVKTFEAVCLEEPQVEDKAKLARMRATATSTLRSALSHVGSMVQAHRKVVSETALDARAADYVVAQVVKILQERVADDDLRLAIVQDLEELKVPSKVVSVVIE